MRARFLNGFFVLAFAAAMLAECRYTRPSDHGLAYQAASRGHSSPAMAAFFGGSSSKDDVALPKSFNSSEPAWHRGRSREGRREHHVKKVLVVASLVCGITGVALLVVVAFLIVSQFRRRPSESGLPSDK